VIAAAPTAVRVCFQATGRETAARRTVVDGAARVRRCGPASRRQSGRRRAASLRQLAKTAVTVTTAAATHARADHRPGPDEFRRRATAMASCSSVIGTSTGGCTWSGAPAAPGRRPRRAVVSLWPSWRFWPTPATSAATAAEQAPLGAAQRCSGGRRVSVDGLWGCCCAMGWSPRPADCRHRPIRLLGANATGCWRTAQSSVHAVRETSTSEPTASSWTYEVRAPQRVAFSAFWRIGR
jgi:hypothetical protein